jgi:hypothetical protein
VGTHKNYLPKYCTSESHAPTPTSIKIRRVLNRFGGDNPCHLSQVPGLLVVQRHQIQDRILDISPGDHVVGFLWIQLLSNEYYVILALPSHMSQTLKIVHTPFLLPIRAFPWRESVLQQTARRNGLACQGRTAIGRGFSWY